MLHLNNYNNLYQRCKNKIIMYVHLIKSQSKMLQSNYLASVMYKKQLNI